MHDFISKAHLMASPDDLVCDSYANLYQHSANQWRPQLPFYVPTHDSLGIKGINSEFALSAGSAGLLKPDQHKDSFKIARLTRHLRPGSTAKRCGSWVGSALQYGSVGDQTVLCSNLARCKSSKCPFCKILLMERRKNEIQSLIDHYLSEKSHHQVSMLTLTVPHYIDTNLKNLYGSSKLRTGLLGSLSRLKERSVWKTAAIDHYVSAIETTYGENGFHPHCHILIFHNDDLPDFFDTWLECCVSSGLGEPSREFGVCFHDAEHAAGYITKWGAGAEVTQSHRKHSKRSYQIWQLETMAASGDTWAASILRIYYKAFHRKRVHTFSRGLKSLRILIEFMREKFKPLWQFDEQSSYIFSTNDELLKQSQSDAKQGLDEKWLNDSGVVKTALSQDDVCKMPKKLYLDVISVFIGPDSETRTRLMDLVYSDPELSELFDNRQSLERSIQLRELNRKKYTDTIGGITVEQLRRRKAREKQAATDNRRFFI